MKLTEFNGRSRSKWYRFWSAWRWRFGKVNPMSETNRYVVRLDGILARLDALGLDVVQLRQRSELHAAELRETRRHIDLLQKALADALRNFGKVSQ
jgi:hypothetical protein